MNITEANETNTVLDYLLGLPGPSGEVPSDETARAAAAHLAEKANKALGAGLTAQAVTDNWHRVQVCPATEATS